MDRPETFAKVQQLVIIGAWLLGRVHPVQARSAILHRVHERLPRARARPPARVTAAEERTATILTGTTRSSPAFHVHRHVRGARHSAGDVTSRLTITVVCTALTTAVAPTSVRSSPGRTLRGGRRMSSVNLVARMMAVMVALTGWVALPTSVFAWSHGCGGPNPVTQEQDFVGIAEAHAGATGARAKIEWSASIDPTLCTTVGGDSFASSWVAVVGPTPFDIYQVGIDKCQGGACAPTSGPDNTPYYFTALGRHASAECGQAVGPTPVQSSQGLATAGSLWYQIFKSSSSTFQARIGGTNAGASVSSYYLNTCWGGVTGVQYLNEVWDIFDQTPGRVSDQQFWSSVSWTDAAGSLVSINRPFSAACDAAGRTAMKCQVASNLHDAWYTWDSRQP